MGDIQLQDLLLHRAGLKPWKAFYYNTLENLWGVSRIQRYGRKGGYVIPMGGSAFMQKNVIPSPEFYSFTRTPEYSIPIEEHMWGRNGLGDSVISEIVHTPLVGPGKFVYSDWGFILLQQVVERVTGKPLDQLAEELVYKPLHMDNTGYAPWRYGKSPRCVPSEHDLYFRKSVVQGYVHDRGAALMGGIAGHAGVFSTAWDIATYGQMLLQGGEYGSIRLYNTATVRSFTQTPEGIKDNYRGYGFDKPRPSRRKSSYIGDSVSLFSYGHIGFTGTILWIDPQEDFLFVLLSNRSYPDGTNLRINSLRIRAQMMNALLMSVKRPHNEFPE